MQHYPVGFWNYVSIDMQTAADVKDWADCGMTYAHSPGFNSTNPDHMERIRPILDAAAEQGIEVTLCDRDTTGGNLARHGEEEYRRRIAALHDAFGDHPAAFGLYIGDEPKHEGFDCFCRATRIQQEEAPDFKPFGNLLPMLRRTCRWIGYENWGNYLDAYVQKARPPLICYDHYSQLSLDPENGEEGFESYFANLRVHHEAARRNGVPYWTTLLSAGHFRLRPPTEDDFRWQLNTALAHGASGILWFFLYMREPHVNYRIPPIDEHYERTETFGWLSRVNRTFLKSIAPVVDKLTLQRVSHVGRAWGGVPLFDGRDGRVCRAEADAPLVISEFTHEDGNEYVMVVNNSQTQNTQARIIMRGRRPLLHRVGWMAEEIDQSGGAEFWSSPHQGEDYFETQPWLAPGQAELYRVVDRPA